MTEREAELLPCPCCGSIPHIHHGKGPADIPYAYVRCIVCGLRTDSLHEVRGADYAANLVPSVVAAWNRRPTPLSAEKAIEGLIARLRDEVQTIRDMLPPVPTNHDGPPVRLDAAYGIVNSIESAALAAIREAFALGRSVPPPEPFQQRVQAWMLECFGPEISADRIERNHRFLEEALELVQALGCTASEAHQLVDYTFNRPAGEATQEAGGVLVTLAALASAVGIDMATAGETELARVWSKIDVIRAKQAAKPKHSPLPEPYPPTLPDDVVRAIDRVVEYAGREPMPTATAQAIRLLAEARDRRGGGEGR